MTSLIVKDEVRSTNIDALELIRNGKVNETTIISAKEQTEGVGRNGKKWNSDGGLAISIVDSTNLPAERVTELSLLSAVVARDAMKNAAPDINVTLKWPNDLMVNGKKIGGINLETAIEGKNISYVVIGIGINVDKFPVLSQTSSVVYKATSFKDEGVEIKIEDLVNHISESFSRWSGIFNDGQGFAEIRKEWLDNSAVKPGQKIKVNRNEEETIEGNFKGLDKNGKMLVEAISGKIRVVDYGEVTGGAMFATIEPLVQGK